MRPAAACLDCRYFMHAPLEIESLFAGLSSFSSGHASVRADDGLCLMHDRYVAATSTCERFAAIDEPAFATVPTPCRCSA
jgi:hypothetical protein